ncbi:Homeodomain-like domain-containing protein [Agrococcus baldri]|uniref:Homeodomain-like domain-containing protein n=1 Tax=Agrococcus baldri TaxID=153730 RepID=A0AA94L0A4_9MICO|nr:DUF2637 domain-containing protein [Agrococcus baldri]SFS16296.1 Homeodomain-like domain-containing protein [Agrococcus baldri]
MVGRQRWGWSVVSAAAGTIGIAAGAFWLSFIALADLAARSGITVGQAWVWPLLVDGLIVVATVAVVALDRHRAAWYPWALLIAGALVSVTANAAHALVAADATVPGVLAGIVAAVPPLVLLASTHLTVVLIRSTAPERATADALDVSPAAVPAPTAEPAVAETPPIPEPEQATALPVPVESDPPVPVELPASEGADGRRERAVALREEQWSNKKIAAELGVHPSTVGRWFAHLTDTRPSSTAATSSPADPAGPLSEGAPS